MGKLKEITIMPFALLMLLFMAICDYLKRGFEYIGNKLMDIALK